MKYFFFLLMMMSATNGYAQTKPCNDPCCAKSAKPTKKAKVKESTILSCQLTSDEFRKRKEEVLDVLKAKIVNRQELKNGFKLTFSGSDSTLAELTDFIRTERACCAFLTFSLTVQDRASHILLSITGPKGAKEFIVEEMNL